MTIVIKSYKPTKLQKRPKTISYQILLAQGNKFLIITSKATLSNRFLLHFLFFTASTKRLMAGFPIPILSRSSDFT